MYIRTEPAGLGSISALADRVQMLECEPDINSIDGFVVGDYRLLPAHYKKLMELLQKARASAGAGVPVSLGLVGHTDDSGEEKMNEGLSLMRAHEVQTFFIRQGVQVHGVEGMGETSPRVPNTSPSNRSKNRRVEIIVCVAAKPTSRSGLQVARANVRPGRGRG